MFVKENFENSAEWLWYHHEGERKFVGRFKWKRGPVTRAQFKKQLMKNHTPAEYFAKLDDGQTPLGILRDADYDWYLGMLNR